MKFKLYLLAAFILIINVKVLAAITVTINNPSQYQLADTSVTVSATVGNIINHSIPYIKAKVFDREINLTWTGTTSFTYQGHLSLNGLPALDTITLTVTAVGFNSDTVSQSVVFIHDIRPKITLLYKPSGYIATPALRIIAACTTYTGAACQLTIVNPHNNAVLATATDSIDATVTTTPAGRYDSLAIVAVDDRIETAKNVITYYYEQDPHFVPVFAATGKNVGDIIDFNYNKVLIPYRYNGKEAYGIVDIASDSLTVVPLLKGHQSNSLLTEKGVFYTADTTVRKNGDTIDSSFFIEYNSGQNYYRNQGNYNRGDKYIASADNEHIYIWTIATQHYDTIIAHIPNPHFPQIQRHISVSNEKAVGILADLDYTYFYNQATGVKNFSAFIASREYLVSGNALFYLLDSAGYFTFNAFNGLTSYKIADVGYSNSYPSNWDLPQFTNASRDGFASFNIGIGAYITDSVGNAYSVEGTFDALGDSGNIASIGGDNYRDFYDKHGNKLLSTIWFGKAYYYNGDWYVAYGNVLYKIIFDPILPTQLTTFTGQQKGTANQLNWQTAQEVNTAYFELQHATAANRNFTPLTQVAAAGNSNTTQSYAYTHTSPATGTNYYRLKMVDKDGKFTYSRIVSINNGDSYFKASILPNPVRNNITLQLNSNTAQKVQVSIINLNGTVLITKQFDISAGINTKTIAAGSLAKGTYFIKVTGAGIAQANVKVIKE